ncbi:MAG: family 1 glycosylhydrolase [Polyangiaceae bacterium]|nr:family 1 glycosylhydrolase [Polyangiaceae bacterium]
MTSTARRRRRAARGDPLARAEIGARGGLRAGRREWLAGVAAAGATLALPGCGVDEPVAAAAPSARFRWGVGIENTWMVQADPALDGRRRALDELALTGHYERWRYDLELVAGLGVSLVRYGHPWASLEPAPGVYDWSSLDAPIDRLVALGLEPVLDLLHYGAPAWMRMGIGDPRFEEAFASFAEAAARHFRGRVREFTVCNEPQVSAAFSGSLGVWPPYGRSLSEWARLGARIARAMVMATRAIRSVSPAAAIVSVDPVNWLLADALISALPVDPAALEALRVDAGSFPACLAYGDIGAGHALWSRLVELGVEPSALEWLHAHGAPPDIVGYNHYPDLARPLGTDFTRGGVIPLDEGARDAVEQVEAALRRVHGRHGRPILLTETSAGLTGDARAAYARALGAMAERMLGEGLPLRGIVWWPLVQAAQWAYRELPDTPLAEFLTPGGWNNALYDLGPGLERVPTPAVQALRETVARPQQ